MADHRPMGPSARYIKPHSMKTVSVILFAAKTCMVDPYPIAMEGRTQDLAMFNSIWQSTASCGARCRRTSGRGRCTERVCGRSRHSAAKEDRSARQIRADGADAAGRRRLPRGSRQEAGRISVHQPPRDRPAHNSAPIRTPRLRVDRKHRSRSAHLQHPLLRRTKVTLIYRRTGNLRAVQLLLGHTKIDYVPCRTMSRCG